MLVSYIYDYSNGKRPIGCMIARKTNKGHIQLGYSLCNPKDKFNKRTARLLAMKPTSPEIPNRNVTDRNGDIRPLVEVMETALDKMGERVGKYFFNPKPPQPKSQFNPKELIGKWCLFRCGKDMVGFVTSVNNHEYWPINADIVYLDKIENGSHEGAFKPSEVVEVY